MSAQGRCVHFTCYQLVAAYIAVWWLYTGWYRRKLREQYGLPETPLPDCLLHLLCYRELDSRGFDVDQGTYVHHRPALNSTSSRPRPAATTVPPVQVPMTRM